MKPANIGTEVDDFTQDVPRDPLHITKLSTWPDKDKFQRFHLRRNWDAARNSYQTVHWHHTFFND